MTRHEPQDPVTVTLRMEDWGYVCLSVTAMLVYMDQDVVDHEHASRIVKTIANACGVTEAHVRRYQQKSNRDLS